MTEKELQANIVRLATFRGWYHYHTYSSKKSVRGWPDLVLCKPPKLLFVELKSARGRLTPDQEHWLNLLNQTGAFTYIWKPKHWNDGTIERILI